MIKPIVQQEIDMHLNEGMSVYQIAARLGSKPNTVLKNLRNHGVLRKNLGFSVENDIEKFFRDQGIFVVRQKGDASFDMIIGKDFCDVKAASAIQNVKGRVSKTFKFQLQDAREKKVLKDFKDVDWFLLVFMDDDMGWPIYRVCPSDLESRKTLSVPYSLKSKYPLQFVGYLRKK